MPGWLKALVGGLEIAGGAAIDFFTAGTAGNSLIAMGIGTEISAIGGMLSKNGLNHSAQAGRFSSNDPWVIPYGRNLIDDATCIYDYEWGDSDKYRDMVFCIADCQIQDVYGLLFDRQRVQIDTTKTLTGVPPSTFPAINGGCSFSPLQQTNIDIQGISRVNNVVQVQLGSDIPLLQPGDKITIHGVIDDQTLNGTFPVLQILSQVYDPPSPGSVIFTYLCGGAEVDIIGQGKVDTNWPDYGGRIYIEVLQGLQTLGQTFVGMTLGTPTNGDVTNPAHPGAGTNPWTADCSCVGKAVAMIRVNASSQYFPGNNLPQISFLVHGKNNIYDPRTGTTGYSENPALCIADYMCDQTYGFKCQLDNDPPSLPGRTVNTAQLITAAIICDEQVEVATPITSPPSSLPRYSCNGRFQLSMKRGQILQNMLTSCAGRITFDNGSYKIGPAAWYPTLVVAPSGFSGQSLVIQNATKVAGGEQANFPMLISGTYPQLKGIAYGGQVQNASGYDITFSLDAAGTELTSWEVESYDSTTGAIIVWVLMPLISASFDAQIFMNYGNPSISTFQGGATGAVWSPTGHQSVLHFQNGTVLSTTDSSGNGNDGTLTGSVPAAGGLIDGGAQLGGGNITIPAAPSASAGSLEIWALIGYNPSTCALIGTYSYMTPPYAPVLYAFGIGIQSVGYSFGIDVNPGGVWDPLHWQLFCLTWDETGVVNLYVNGTLLSSIAYSAPPSFSDIVLGGTSNIEQNPWGGYADEFRASTVARTQGWTATRYNNETSPSTFYSIFTLGDMPINAISAWGPVKWRATSTGRELFNGVKGTMVLPWANWTVGDFPPYCQDTLHGYVTSPPTPDEGDINLYYDGGDRRWMEIQLPFTIECPTAQQIAKIYLLRSRHSAGNGVGTGTIALSMAGYVQTALDIVTFTFPFAQLLSGAVKTAWTNKILEIAALRLKMELQQNAVALSTEVDVAESDPSNYYWNVSEELSPAGYAQTLPAGSNNAPAPPTNLVVTVGPGVSLNEAGGVGQCTLLVTWTAPADGFVLQGGQIQAQYQLATSPPGPWIALPSVSPSVTSLVITGVQEGASYTVQLQSVNSAGVPSGWVDAQTNSSPPETVITVSGALSQLYTVNGV